MRRKVLYPIVAILVVGIGIQLIPVNRTNPPVDPAATFDAIVNPAPEVAALLKKACKDCHSNETVWPIYGRIAPASWLVAWDVNHGRARLNLSEWRLLSPDMSRMRMLAMCVEVKSGEMPPFQYRLIHTEARLSDEEVSMLCSISATK